MARQDDESEEKLLHSVSLQNALSIHQARLRAEEELVRAKQALESRTQELSRSLEELHRQQEWFKVTLSSIGDAVITTDLDAKITFLNPVAEAMTGWPLAEARGKPLTAVFNIANEYTMQPAPNPVTTVLKAGIVVGLANHTVLIGRDGRITSIEDSAAPILDSDGRVAGAVMVFHDVTDRRRSEEVLRESEERFRATFSQAAMGMVVSNLSGKVELANQKFAQMLGYSLEELTHLTFVDLTHPDHLAETEINKDGILRGDFSEYSYDKRFLRKDGQAFWGRATVTMLRDAAGKPLKFIGVVEDITQRKETEQALLRSETRLNLAMEAGQMGTWEWIIAKAQVVWSPALETMHGLEVGSFGGTFEDFQRDMHPDDHERVLLTIQECMRTRESYRVEYRIIRPSGAVAWIEARGRLFLDSQGNPERMIGICMDVSARKHAENALRESERFNRAVIESSRDCIKTLGLDGNFLWISDVGRKHLQVNHSDALVGKSWVSYWEGENRVAAEAALKKAIGGGSGSFVGQLQIAGRLLWFDVLVAPMLDAHNQPEKLLVVSREVTERKQIEEARFRLAALVESSEDAILSKSLNGTITSWNKAAERILGYLAEEVIGKPVTVLIPPDRLGEEPVIIENLKQGVRIEPYETIRMCKDGTLLDVSLTVSPIMDASGKIIGASKIIRDITQKKRTEEALRESEQRFRVAADTAPVLLGITGPDKLCRYSSRFWLDFVGRTLEQELGNGWTENIHRDDLAGTMAKYDHAFELRLPFEIEFRLRHHTGEYRWIAARGIPRIGHNAVFEGYIVGATDIHDRKMASQEREQLLEAERSARTTAERVNVMKDEFLATLSHELRTPMSAILGWSQLLVSGKLDSEGFKRGLDSINRNAHVQSQLIEDLLDMSRIVSGKVTLEPRLMDLNGVVEAAISTIQPSANAKDISLRVVFDTPGHILGDPNRLQQVMWNLLSNAVKFTPRGGKVDVRLRKVHSNIEVTVADTGVGIAPDLLAYVFERFRQGDASTTRSYGGLGLGLAIVKHLVELHGGTSQAHSAGAGQGSVFTLLIPAASDAALSVVLPVPPPPEVENTNLIGTAILVVDDEPDGRELVARILTEYKARVVTASNASEAFALVQSEKPAAIVADIGMPGEDGYQFIQRVRCLKDVGLASIPAIALTAFARPEDQARAVQAGYQVHLAKPINPNELISSLSRLVSRT